MMEKSSFLIHQVKRGVPEFIKEKHQHQWGFMSGKVNYLGFADDFLNFNNGKSTTYSTRLGESKERGIPSNKPELG